MRIKAVIAYDGSRFQGFQRQKSTKDTITTAIEIALRSLNITSDITGSGRTDAGVHASGQVIHFDLPDFWHDLGKLKDHLNIKLQSIEFKHIALSEDNFHARFDARERVYRYVFKTIRPTIFEQNFISHLPLDSSSRLNQALSRFVGEHDFGNFLKTGSETKDHIRQIYKAYHKQRGDYHFIYFHANGFLRAQVRMMIDFAIKVANEELDTTQLQNQLNLKSIHSKNLAPAQGLYLARVIY